MPTGLLYVLDKPEKPRRLHRTDCWHPVAPVEWRKATKAELTSLPPCKDCQEKD